MSGCIYDIREMTFTTDFAFRHDCSACVSTIPTHFIGLGVLTHTYFGYISRKKYLPFTYDHRLWRTGLPVRSAVLKPQVGRLVVGWVTTSEYRLLYVLHFLFGFWSEGDLECVAIVRPGFLGICTGARHSAGRKRYFAPDERLTYLSLDFDWRHH